MTDFPDSFLWGAATAGQQVEGNNVLSDIWAMEHIAGSPFAEPSGDACNSYHLWAEDIDLVATSGLNSYRFSIEWSRIEPEEGVFARAELNHYRDMLEECRRRGVTPVVTLNHFTVPAWFARGGAWSKPDAPELFERFTRRVVEHMKGLVRWWVTFNEPNAGAMLVATGALPLGSVSDSDTLTEGQHAMMQAFATRVGGELGVASMALPIVHPDALRNVFESHRRARAAIKEIQPSAMVGWSPSVQDYQALPGGEEKVQAVLDAAIHPFWEESRSDDFLGVQTYTREIYGPEGRIHAQENLTQTGWESYPEALGNVVAAAAEFVGVPILVTENGIATADDDQRIQFTQAALRSLAEARDGGADVRGYMHWTLLDNWEWHTGFAMTFGLVEVDRDTFARTAKPSLGWLGQVAQTHGAHLGAAIATA